MPRDAETWLVSAAVLGSDNEDQLADPEDNGPDSKHEEHDRGSHGASVNMRFDTSIFLSGYIKDDVLQSNQSFDSIASL